MPRFLLMRARCRQLLNAQQLDFKNENLVWSDRSAASMFHRRGLMECRASICHQLSSSATPFANLESLVDLETGRLTLHRTVKDGPVDQFARVMDAHCIGWLWSGTVAGFQCLY